MHLRVAQVFRINHQVDGEEYVSVLVDLDSFY